MRRNSMPLCKKKWPDEKTTFIFTRREEALRRSSLRSSPFRFVPSLFFAGQQSLPCSGPALPQFSTTFQSAEATKMSFSLLSFIIKSLQHYSPSFSTALSETGQMPALRTDQPDAPQIIFLFFYYNELRDFFRFPDFWQTCCYTASQVKEVHNGYGENETVQNAAASPDR